MALSLEDGYSFLIDTITNNKTHQDYEHVTKLADKYKILITGANMDTLLRRFVRREDDVMFAQRIELTKAITPAVSSMIMNPFYKIGRVVPVVKSIGFKKKEDEKPVQDALDKFYGDKSLDEYLETRFVELSFTDPNSFIVIEFDAAPVDAQGNLTEKVDPRPLEVSAKEAINFKYKNNILQALIVKYDIEYGEKEKGNSYTIYLDNDAVKFTQVDSDDAVGQVGGFTISTDGIKNYRYYRVSEKILFIVEEFKYNAERVPAFRVGYKTDLETDARTFVNPFHSALCYFEKSIKSVSELDLTMSLHAFPQKIAYGPRCTGETPELGCDNGRTSLGAQCNKCRGHGIIPLHTTAQDAIVFKQPKDPADMIDLDKTIVYKSLPIDLLDIQISYTNQLTEKAKQTVFNADLFSKTEVTATATEKTIDLDNVYDTLFPFGKNFSKAWKYFVVVIAKFRDAKDIIPDHRLPKDLKFKSLTELLGVLATANTSGAPGYVRQQIGSDIAEQQFTDKPDQLKKVKVKQLFYPFSDKNTQEILYIISNGKTTLYEEILWANFDSIFRELEVESEATGNSFYDLAYKNQKELLDLKVKAVIDLIKAEAPAPAMGFGDFNNGEGNPSPSEDIGKIPLALQQLALARTRAEESGDKALAKQIGDKMDDLLNQI